MNIHIRNLDYMHRRGAHAVRDASLVIEAGAAVGLIGPNGAGKSTLLACLLGFLTPRRGSIQIDCRGVDDLVVKARTGVLGEKPSFPSGMSARAVLEFHHALLGLPARSRRVEVGALLERVGLSACASRKPAGFSHGMRQRLGLACALLGDPSLLVLDEPATGLDPPGIQLLRDELAAARRRGATILLSSHQLDEVERACDSIAFMSAGQLGPLRRLDELTSGRRIVRIRILTSDGAPASPEAWSPALDVGGVKLLESSSGSARIEADSEAACGRLAARIMASGLLVADLRAEETALDRLFRGEAS